MTACHCRCVLSAFALLLACSTAAAQSPRGEGELPATGLLQVDDWENYARVRHYAPEGIPCYENQGGSSGIVRYLYYKQPLYLLERGAETTRIRVDDETCVVESDLVEQMHTAPLFCVAQPKVMPVLPIERFMDVDTPEEPAGLQGRETIGLGSFYPTFYQVALESLYPLKQGGKPVLLRDNDGNEIAHVSPEFRRALLRQGTGSLADGRVLNVGRKTRKGRRFIVLPESSFGLGVKGYHLYPYRSVAVDFDMLCQRLGGSGNCDPDNVIARDSKVSRKNKSALAGSLLYLPRLDGVKLAGGTEHDGFMCAVDVGGGIKNDRIDIFVGTDGAGNPYYPPCRHDNALILSGVRSLIPSDWRHFAQDKDGNRQRELQTEYRQTAKHKGLEVYLVPGVKCRHKASRRPE